MLYKQTFCLLPVFVFSSACVWRLGERLHIFPPRGRHKHLAFAFQLSARERVFIALRNILGNEPCAPWSHMCLPSPSPPRSVRSIAFVCIGPILGSFGIIPTARHFLIEFCQNSVLFCRAFRDRPALCYNDWGVAPTVRRMLS